MSLESDRRGFLETIRASPDDDLARLVFADWLDEHDSPERAEFIRVQVELAPLADVTEPVVAGPIFAEEFDTATEAFREWERKKLLTRRERELLTAERGAEWLGELPGCTPTAIVHGKTRAVQGFAWWQLKLHNGSESDGIISAEFVRGFAGFAMCAAGDWLRNADAILASHPVTKVTLTSRPNVSSTTTSERFNGALSGGGCERLVTRPCDVWLDTLTNFDSDRAMAMLSLLWPGVTFTLPT
jgi:uncharacterized protein (TIGR02996 family)